MSTAAIGLGANLPSIAGAPETTIAAAIEHLAECGRIKASSSLYRTAPVGYLQQPAFINAAVLLETEDSPHRLLDILLAIERRYGRDRTQGPPKGPRTLDLDLLLYDDLVLNERRLILPHPALHERAFVLMPLAEIAPAWPHPVLGRSIAELNDALHVERGDVARISE